MNFSIHKKVASLLLISSFIIADNSINNNINPVSILDNFTDQALKQLEKTHNSISEMSRMINDGQVPNITHKEKVIQEIKQISHLIQAILQEKFISVSPDTILFLTYYSRAIMFHIMDIIANNFKNISEFSLEKYPFLRKAIAHSMQRKPIRISPKRLHQELMFNEELLTKFSKQADQIGLAWWNILYRNFDKYLVDPCQRYKIPQRALGGFTIGLSYIVLSWYLGENLPRFLQLPEHFKNSPWFKKLIGEKPFGFHSMMSDGQVQMKDEEIKGFLNRLNLIVAGIKRDVTPVNALLISGTFKIAHKEWNTFKPFFDEKISILTNTLKGGSYLKKANKLQGIIEEVHFNDLVGISHVKEFYKNLIAYLENPEPFDRLGISPPKGCLLIGDTRTGKSYSVQALFTELNTMLERNDRKNEFKFFELSASDINKDGIGYLLKVIKICAPCIVFIDEIDLLDLQRRGKNSMLSEFLTCMSGALSSGDSKNQVIIIAATNRPENLDEALRTPGRFGKELRFEYPSFKDRREFIVSQLDKLSLNTALFDIDKLTQETEGKAYESLKLLINQSVLKARIRGEMLTQNHLEETLNEIIRNVIEENFKEIPSHEKELLSIHFSGHALALMLLNMHIKLASVTIKPVMMHIKEEFMGAHLWQSESKEDKQKFIEYGEIFTHQDRDTINIMTRKEKLNLCRYYLAGIAAEEIIFGSCSFSCHTKDKEKALALIKSLVFEGVKVNNLPDHIKNQLYDEVFGLLNTCKKEIVNLLNPYKEKLSAIAQSLQDRNTLNKKDILHIMEQSESDATINTDIAEEENSLSETINDNENIDDKNIKNSQKNLPNAEK